MIPRPAPHVVRWFLRTFGFGGITLPPLGIFILPERLHQGWLVRHEQAHWQQAQRMGVVRWAITYLFYNVRYGYWDNPLEVEARAAELSS
jgi:hypothetical protein